MFAPDGAIECEILSCKGKYRFYAIAIIHSLVHFHFPKRKPNLHVHSNKFESYMLTYFVILIFLLLSGFFSGTEIAFVSASRLKVELKRQQGNRRGHLLAGFFERPSKFIGTTLVGNNIALVFFSLLVEQLIETQFKESLVPFLQKDFPFLLFLTLITTIIVLIFGEFIPKILFRLSPVNLLYFFTYPLYVIGFLLTPLVWVMVRASHRLLALLFKTEVKVDEQVFTRNDLENFIKTSDTEGEEEIDKELFENALYLNDVKVRECMIPRTEIKGVDISVSVEELRAEFIESKLSKLIIYDESLDEIRGYFHHQQMLNPPEDITRKNILPIDFVPEVMSARELMNQFIRKRVSIACVVDEFGGTAGIITLEDILEEIVGEIEDEHDKEDYIEDELGNGEYLFSGRLEIDQLNEKYDLNLPEGEYNTLSGYIVITTETIPEQGKTIELEGYQFVLEKVSERKIETIRVIRLEEE